MAITVFIYPYVFLLTINKLQINKQINKVILRIEKKKVGWSDKDQIPYDFLCDLSKKVFFFFLYKN